MNNPIDIKIAQLLELTNNFLIVEYYTHSDAYMYKIFNEFTHYNEEKLVLCTVEEGIEEALNLAISYIAKKKAEFFGEEYSDEDICRCKMGEPYNNLCCPVHGNADVLKIKKL